MRRVIHFGKDLYGFYLKSENRLLIEPLKLRKETLLYCEIKHFTCAHKKYLQIKHGRIEY